jgi:catechol 2,3-dioxygenase-like lactoylglutathione lyase family enzyme
LERARLDNVAPVLVSADVRRTAEYYRDSLGFEVVEHYESAEPFVALYRDSVELALHLERTRNQIRLLRAGFSIASAEVSTINGRPIRADSSEIRARGCRR